MQDVLCDCTLLDIANVVPVRQLPAEAGLCKVFGARRYHGLVLTLAGTLSYSVKGYPPFQAVAGTLLYLPQGRPYTVDTQVAGTCIAINFYLTKPVEIAPFLLPLRNALPFRILLEDCSQRWIGRCVGYRADCMATLYRLLAMIETYAAQPYLPEARSQRLRDAYAALQAHFADADLSISAFCAQWGMSAVYFRKQFTAFYGASPKQQLLQIRINRARDLLTSTTFPITQIAQLCGYDTIYLFSRSFKRHTGISPCAYREKERTVP